MNAAVAEVPKSRSRRRRFWVSLPVSDPLAQFLESQPSPSKFIREAVQAHVPGSVERELQGLRKEVQECRSEIEALNRRLTSR